MRDIKVEGLPNPDSIRLAWIGAAVVATLIFAMVTVRIGRVTGETIGFLLNKQSGELKVIHQSGAHIYNGLTHEFFTMDKTMQTMEMSGTGNNLKIKTVDGSDVHVDLKVQYRIEPELGAKVLVNSGPGDAYKEKWARDYVRAIVRNYLGELTTEEFYDAYKRDGKVTEALNESNLRLEPFGIVIDSIVIPKRPQFYADYEEMIKKKKLADQAVLEEQSKAKAAQQGQTTDIQVQNNKKNVVMQEMEGKMEQKIIQSKAEGEKVRKGADAYYEKNKVGAEALFYEKQKKAEAILAERKAEAEGLEELKKALAGEGGANLVKMEYARRLKDMVFTGRPFYRDSHTGRFERLDAATEMIEANSGALKGARK